MTPRFNVSLGKKTMPLVTAATPVYQVYISCKLSAEMLNMRTFESDSQPAKNFV
jgi:hypothetical protein